MAHGGASADQNRVDLIAGTYLYLTLFVSLFGARRRRRHRRPRFVAIFATATATPGGSAATVTSAATVVGPRRGRGGLNLF